MPSAKAESGYTAIPAIHLVIRFVLELVMFAGVGLAGWGNARYPGAALAALGAIVLWVVFGTEGDGSRGAPIVPTPGRVRLLIEAALFAIAAYGIWTVWSRAAAETFLTITILHYGITWERQLWLVRGGSVSANH